MNHLSDERILLSADGELNREEQSHLETCPVCQARKAALDRAMAAYGDALAPNQGPEARAQLRSRLATRPASPWRYLRPVAASVVAAAGGWMLLQSVLSPGVVRPRPNLTPGEVRPISVSEVCQSRKAEVVAHVSEPTRRNVLLAYGIRSDAGFEVDYLITPDLGGVETVRNLWPQPYGVRWNARAKDELEQRLHELVCEGKMELSTAQREIATDWIGAYKKYVIGPR